GVTSTTASDPEEPHRLKPSPSISSSRMSRATTHRLRGTESSHEPPGVAAERTGAFGAGRAEGTGTNGRWAEGSGSGVLAGLAARISILGWAAPGRAEGRDSASLVASNAGWLALKVRGVGDPFPGPSAGMFPGAERRAGRLPRVWVRPVPPVRAPAASRDGGGAPWGVGRRVSFTGMASRPAAGIEGREPVRRTPEVARTSPEGGRVGVRRGPEPGSPTWG